MVTDKAKDIEVGRELDNIEEIYYYKNPEKQTPIQLINNDIKKLNRDFPQDKDSYTQLKEE